MKIAGTHALFVITVSMFSLLLLGGAILNTSHASAHSMPFYPGEKLTFTLKWERIPAGKAVLEVLPVKTINGEDVYHFVMTARTNSFVDMFYKVRDRIESYTSLDMTRSLLYKKKQREGDYTRDIEVHFDWEQHKAQ